MDFTVTLGQYVKGNSFLYRLDPRFKIIALITLMVLIFLIPNIYILLGVLGLVLLLMILGRLNILMVIKGLQPIVLVSLFTFILQLIYSPKENLLYTFKLNISLLNIILGVLLLFVMFFTSKYITKFKLLYYILILAIIFLLFSFVNINWMMFKVIDFNIYKAGLINGAFYALRIVLLVMISTILTMTTSTLEINSGLESVLSPLKLIKIPVSELAMMLSLTLRFIPSLVEETDKIMKAQASRGVDFSEGSFKEKIKHIITLIIPMFAVSFSKAEDLANAMIVRGYVVGAKRTSVNELKLHLIDYIGFFLLAVFIALTVLVRIYL